MDWVFSHHGYMNVILYDTIQMQYDQQKQLTQNYGFIGIIEQLCKKNKMVRGLLRCLRWICASGTSYIGLLITYSLISHLHRSIN